MGSRDQINDQLVRVLRWPRLPLANLSLFLPGLHDSRQAPHGLAPEIDGQTFRRFPQERGPPYTAAQFDAPRHSCPQCMDARHGLPRDSRSSCQFGLLRAFASIISIPHAYRIRPFLVPATSMHVVQVFTMDSSPAHLFKLLRAFTRGPGDRDRYIEVECESTDSPAIEKRAQDSAKSKPSPL